MNESVLFEIALIFLLLILNGIFAMTEIAMVTARKARLQQKAEEGSLLAGSVLKVMETPNRFLSAIQIGITLIGIFAGAIGGATLAERLATWLERFPLITPYAEGISLLMVVLLTTYFSLVIGELIPKRIGMNNPEEIALRMVGPLKSLSVITGPVVRLLSVSTDLGLRLLGMNKLTDAPVTQEEIQVLIEQGTQVGVFEAAEQTMVEGVFRLGDRYVDALMTPRTELEWIDLEDSVEEILQQVMESKHTRFPVARKTLDNVIGILSAKDLLTARLAGQPIDFIHMVEPPLFIPDSTTALNMLDRLRQTEIGAAVVIDEYGGLLGMITLHDVLAAIAGFLPAIGEDGLLDVVRREDGSWLLDGLLSIDTVRELLQVQEFPEEARVGFQTLGGFVMNQLGTIPMAGQTFEWNHLRFEVLDMDERRVDKVLVTPLTAVSRSIEPSAAVNRSENPTSGQMA